MTPVLAAPSVTVSIGAQDAARRRLAGARARRDRSAGRPQRRRQIDAAARAVGRSRRRRGTIQLKGRGLALISSARAGAAPGGAVAEHQRDLSVHGRRDRAHGRGRSQRTGNRRPGRGRARRGRSRRISTTASSRTLSGGEQQRAHFARVLVQLACGEAAHGPGVLLLDEPTASLDLRHQLDIASRRRGAAPTRGVAVVAILHDLNLAALFAKRIVVLDGGRVAPTVRPATTITDAMLAQVFEVAAAVGRVPRARRSVRAAAGDADRRATRVVARHSRETRPFSSVCADDPHAVLNPVVMLCDFCNARGFFRQGHSAARFFCSDVADLLQGKGVSS